jgi:RND family efflux transporter MFP subunit
MMPIAKRAVGTILAGALAACGGAGREQPVMSERYDGPVATAASVTVTRYAPTAAILAPRRSAVLTSRTMAQVLTVSVLPGERVRAGQLLVQLDDRDLRAAERRAEASLFEAQAVEREAERNLIRMQNLIAQRAVAQATYDAAKTGHDRALAAVRTAEAALAETRAHRAYTTLRAPFDGIASARLVEPGDFVAPGQPLVRMEDQSGYEARAQASRSAVAAVALGDTVPVSVPPSEARLRAVVVSVAPAQDPASSSLDVKVRFLDAPDAPTGTFVRVWIPQREELALLVPPSALTRRGQLTGLYLLGPDDRPSLRWIETGDSLEIGVHVVAGLREGDRYAVDAAAVEAARRRETS